jgi:hypothetical protein
MGRPWLATMPFVTSLRRIHRELVAVIVAGGSDFLGAGTADAAVTTPLLHMGVAGIGFQSVP